MNKLKFLPKLAIAGFSGIALSMMPIWKNTASAFEFLECDTTIPPASRTCSASDVTEGWDGPGLGSYNFGYFIGNPFRLTDQGLPPGLTLAEITTAFSAAASTWSSVASVTFTPVANFGDGEIDFYFHNGADGVPDGIPFDGPWNPSTGVGNVYAHTWGPPDVSFDPAVASNAGNMHFDIGELWSLTGTNVRATSADIDLESIILHELGHALGLAHEDSMGSGIGAPIMQSFHNVDGTWARTLTQDDVDGIRQLYGCVDNPEFTPCEQEPESVPEPSTLGFLALSTIGVAILKRKKES